MRVAIGVVAHHARADQAHALQEAIGAQYLSMSNGNLTCEQNHRRVWSYLASKDTEWSVCVEDDCVPVEGFRDQLEQALMVAPTPIVSLYLGANRPKGWQQRIGKALNAADNTDASWIVGKHVLHAVAIAIRTDLLPEVRLDTRLAIDTAWTKWRRANHHDVAYTVPSLCDHRDDAALVDHSNIYPTRTPRKAWRVGARDTWNARTVQL